MVRPPAMMRLLLPILGKLQTKIMLRQTKDAARIQNSSNATIKIVRSRHRSFRFRCLCSVFCHSLLMLSFSSCAEQRPAYSKKAVHGVKISICVQQYSNLHFRSVRYRFTGYPSGIVITTPVCYVYHFFNP